jgi:hypothetical protein
MGVAPLARLNSPVQVAALSLFRRCWGALSPRRRQLKKYARDAPSCEFRVDWASGVSIYVLLYVTTFALAAVISYVNGRDRHLRSDPTQSLPQVAT